MNLEADKFLEAVESKHADTYAAALEALYFAIATGNKPARADAFQGLVDVQTETMGAGEVLGASLMLQRTAKVLADGANNAFLRKHRELHLNFSGLQSVLPRVTFDEAVEDMVARTPVTIRRAADRTASTISRLYGEGRVVAFAHSAEAAVTKHVQSMIAQAVREGIGEVNIGARIMSDVNLIRKRSKKWTEGYARMAFRTNLNTAVTAGRFRQAQDPDIKAVVPCFQFDDVGDGDTRDNHRAPPGLIFKVDNPVWNKIAPPLGYNCRCQVRIVTVPMLLRLGRIDASGAITESRLPPGLQADKGFRHGGRPDLFMVA